MILMNSYNSYINCIQNMSGEMYKIIKKVCKGDRTSLVGIIAKNDGKYYYIPKELIYDYEYENGHFDKSNKLKIDKLKMTTKRYNWIIMECERDELITKKRIISMEKNNGFSITNSK